MRTRRFAAFPPSTTDARLGQMRPHGADALGDVSRCATEVVSQWGPLEQFERKLISVLDRRTRETKAYRRGQVIGKMERGAKHGAFDLRR